MHNVYDRRNCPDWMHIRQYVYLEQTSPRTLAAALWPTTVPDRRNRQRTIDVAGMISQRFAQRYERGSRCSLCGVATVKGESVAYWGNKQFGHALCRIAAWTAEQDAREHQKAKDAEQARRRRSRGKNVIAARDADYRAALGVKPGDELPRRIGAADSGGAARGGRGRSASKQAKQRRRNNLHNE